MGCELLNMHMEGDELTTEEFIEKQWKDPEYKPLLQYLVNEKLPDEWEKAKTVLVRIELLGVNKDGLLCKFDDPKRRKVKEWRE